MTRGQEPSLREWLEVWSRGPVEPGTSAEMVGRLLTFNQLARTPWREGDVDVLVAENQGVWLWGRTEQGDFVERENESGSPWLPTGEDEDAFWLHQAAFEFLSSRFPAHRSQNDASRPSGRSTQRHQAPPVRRLAVARAPAADAPPG